MPLLYYFDYCREFAIMSRFFATGSDSESDSASEEEQVPRAPATAFTVCIIKLQKNFFKYIVIFLFLNLFLHNFILR